MDERTAAYYTCNARRLAADYQVAGSDYFATLDREFAVDHAMPFALWRNNDLWNLRAGARPEKRNRPSDPGDDGGGASKTTLRSRETERL